MIDLLSRKTHNQIKQAFKDIKEEFEDHLESINENTNEIQSNYEFLCEVDNKVEKLNERLDTIQMFLEKLTNQKLDSFKELTHVQPLSIQEQRLFLTLYTSEDAVSYPQMAERIHLTESLVRQYMTNLIEKGVPVTKQYINRKPFVSLNPDFKELQAKKNIVNLDDSVLRKTVTLSP